MTKTAFILNAGHFELSGPRPKVTPLIELQAPNGNRLFAKLEAFQITGSIKGRTALGLLTSLTSSGRAKHGDYVVESSSGNLLAALAELGPAFGYNVIGVVDEKLPAALRARALKAGATLREVPPGTDRAFLLDARLRIVSELAAQTGHHWINQYANPAAQSPHFLTTGPELIAQMKQACGGIDLFLCPVSTGGTISGTGKALKQHAAQIEVVGVDIPGSAIFGEPPAPRSLNGIGASMKPANVDLQTIDWHEVVPEKDAVSQCLRALKDYGLFIGGSSGAALAAAMLAVRRVKNRRIVALFPDGGATYADTIFNPRWRQQHGFSRNPRMNRAAAHNTNIGPVPLGRYQKGDGHDE